jgi:hypothetical protein
VQLAPGTGGAGMGGAGSTSSTGGASNASSASIASSGTGGVASTCKDGMRDGKETDVDCGGGACPACANGKGCIAGSDCMSKVCTGGACIAPSCGDHVKNGNETDVDCGGGQCPPCDPGLGCAVASDCSSDICSSMKCGDTLDWQHSYGAAYARSSIGNAIGADASGNVYVAGLFSGMIDFGCNNGPLTSHGAGDIFLAKLDPNGKCVWQQAFGSAPGYTYSVSMSAFPKGGVVIFGTFGGPLTFDKGVTMLDCPFGADFYTAMFDANGGSVYSSRSPWGGVSGGGAGGVALDTAGDAWMIGTFGGTIRIANSSSAPPVVSTSTSFTDVFMAKLNSAGGYAWANHFGDGAHNQYGTTIAADTSGNAFAMGAFSGTFAFGSLSAIVQSKGPGYDAFLVKFDSVGNPLWTQTFHGFAAKNDSFWNVTLDATGNIIVVGGLDGVVNFGCPAPVASQGSTDVFVAKFEPTMGKCVWSNSWGDAQGQAAFVASTDASGNIYVVGTFMGTLNFGGSPTTAITNSSTTTDDMFVVKFDSAGNHIWSRRYGTPQEDDAAGVAATGNGHVFVAVDTNGSISFGDDAGLPSSGTTDFAVAELATP